MAQVSNPSNTTSSDPSIVDYLNKSGQNSSYESRSQLYATTFGSAAGGAYTGSAAQNTALLHALQTGYKSNVNNSSITGSSSVTQGNNTTTAMNAASASLTPPGPAPSPSTTSPASQLLAPSQNPQFQQIQQEGQQALQQAQEDYQSALKPMTDSFTANITQLQQQRTQALAAAKASYAQANPDGSGSDQDEFLDSITQGYDTQITNATTAYNDSVGQLGQTLSDNTFSINQQTQANIATWNANNQSQLNFMATNGEIPPLQTDAQPGTPEYQTALMSWAANNPEVMQLAENSASYGDMTTVQGYLAAAAALSAPNKADIEEETSEENAASNASRASSAAISAGATSYNAQLNAQKLAWQQYIAQYPGASTATSNSLLGQTFNGKTTTTNKSGNPAAVYINGTYLPTSINGTTVTLPTGNITFPSEDSMNEWLSANGYTQQ